MSTPEQTLEDLAARAMAIDNMTVAEAQERYRAHGEKCIHPAFRELVTQVAKSDQKADFPNNSYLDALFLIEMMLKRAKRSIRVLSGSQGDGFFGVLERPFRDAIDRLSATGGTVRIIILSRAVPSFFLTMKAPTSVAFDFVTGQANNPEGVRHFMVFDSCHTRVEEPHSEITEATPASRIQARMLLNAPSEALILEDRFDAMWKILAQPVLC